MNKARYNIDDLIDIMQQLRTPVTGCPWDLEQNFKSIAPYTLEEAYEVIDAIDRCDMNALQEELGDLLLQPIYHAQLASELGHFTIHEVIHDIAEKMVMRHPHVFGDKKAADSNAVNDIWEKQKAAEKPANTVSCALENIPKAFPALLYAQKMTKKAAKCGFEWPSAESALEKVHEELGELAEAVTSPNQEHIEEEMGDLLLAISNYSRMLGINPEEALRKANVKFYNRFSTLERTFKIQNKDISDVSLDEMLHVWTAQKQAKT